MSNRSDGGWAREGLTIRDYFATEALPIANAAVGLNSKGWIGVANVAYSIADAMLEARKK